ncbi:MAG: response regulator [Bdellovibrionales bacterium]|nr:response regulator [Bdellovibrionales bacterium]
MEVAVFQELSESNDKVIVATLQNESIRQQTLVMDHIHHQMLALDRMAARLLDHSKASYQVWLLDAANYHRDNRGLVALEWVNKNSYLQWIYPEDPNSPFFGKKLNQDPERQKNLREATSIKRGVLSDPIDLQQGGRGFLSFHPTFNKQGVHTGFVVGVYNAEKYFSSLLDKNQLIQVLLNNHVLYNFEELNDKENKKSFSNEHLSNFEFEQYGKRFKFYIKHDLDMMPTKAKYFLIGTQLILSTFLIIFLFVLLSVYRRQTQSMEEKRVYQSILKENLDLSSKNEKLLEQAQQIAKIGNWQYETKAQKVSWSQQMYLIFQMDPFLEEPTPKEFVKKIFADDLDLWKKTAAHCAKTGEPYNIQFRYCLEGNVTWIEAQGQGEVDESGHVIRLYGTCQDITEKKYLEETIKQQEQISLRQSKLASLGQLAAGIGHEINNPLTILMGYLDILKKHVDKLNIRDEKIAYILLKFEISIERIKAVTQGLKTFSRRDDEVATIMSLSQEINKVQEITQEIFQNEGVKLQIENKGNIYFKGPSGKLQQVLLNLLINAKDALEGMKDKEIKVMSTVEDNIIVIQIIDNGPGIPGDIRDKIFEPFFTTKDVNKGTGLGLSLSQRMLQEHDGDIILFSTGDKGTEFRIYIPEYQTVKEQSDEGNSIAQWLNQYSLQCENSKMKILVVDDESDMIDVFDSMLDNISCNMISASNGVEALKILESGEVVDLLITDLKMPVMTGKQLVLSLAQKALINPPRVIVMTGGAQDIESDPQLLSHSDGFIYKPFDQDRLLNLLKTVLEKSSPDMIQKSA